MIMADKIIRLRKKNGWSQEELADKLDVSRQAVSKWEAAQSVPNLDKILQLSELFGVTTDYLLKDDIEDEEFTDNDDAGSVKKITLEDANKYLDTVKANSQKTALATFLCIISAPEGLQKVTEKHPDVEIYTACIDDHLNENKYIVPGLGDAGDRIFGTK